MKVLPVVPNIPDFEFKTSLDGEIFNFRFRWNTVTERYYMSILDSELNDLLLGIPIFVGRILNNAWSQTNSRHPKGDFIVVSKNNEPKATLDNFGESVKIVYRSWLND